MKTLLFSIAALVVGATSAAADSGKDRVFFKLKPDAIVCDDKEYAKAAQDAMNGSGFSREDFRIAKEHCTVLDDREFGVFMEESNFESDEKLNVFRVSWWKKGGGLEYSGWVHVTEFVSKNGKIWSHGESDVNK